MGKAKQHIAAGLVAHVGASRREPHLNSLIPGPKTGDFLHRCLVAQRRYDGLRILYSQDQLPLIFVYGNRTAGAEIASQQLAA